MINIKDFTKYIGQRFGHLTVIDFIPSSRNYNDPNRFIVRCDCGNEKRIRAWSVLSGNSKSCGCMKKTKAAERSIKIKPHKDLTGQIFGHLTAIKYEGDNRWLWQCDCGVQKVIRSNSVIRGLTRSCGHIRKKSIDEPHDKDALGSIKETKRYKDLSGQVFGHLTAVKYVGDKRWLWQCDCGTCKIIRTNNVLTGKVNSCGHLSGRHNERSSSNRFKELKPRVDLTGQVFGHLTAIKYVGDGRWLWQCDCGKQKVIRAFSVKEGHTSSCGHLKRGPKLGQKDYTLKHGTEDMRI